MLKNIVNKNIYGKEPLFNVREISTLRDMFESSTKLFSERIAFMQKYGNNMPYTKITYRQFRTDVYSFATALISEGLRGKKIALIGENRYEWAAAYMSIVCGCGTVVPIDKELTANEMKYLIEFAECSAILCTSAVLKRNPGLSDMDIKCICIDTEFITLSEHGKRLIDEGNRDFAEAEVKPEDINALIFTSGTSGTPKGVMLSHKNICTDMMNICTVFKLTKYDRVCSVLPLHHTYECTCGFLCQIYAGASVAYCRGLRYMVSDIQESMPTMFFCVPLIMEGIYKSINRTIEKTGKTKKVKAAMALSKGMLKMGIDIRRKLFKDIIDKFGGRLKLLLVGAAPVNGDIMQFFTDIGITCIQGYGMTECAPIIAENRASHYRNDSVGMPLPELSLRIDNPDERGVGEIVVKGENVMCGYYKNPEETAKVLKDGWLHTGDMGYYRDGFLYITGRLKNLIITSNGENIFPEEIEMQLSDSPYISECMVYQQDNVIMAQIYPDFDEISKLLGEHSEEDFEKLLGEEIKKINSRNPSYKAVKKFIIRKEEFVKTTTRKIKR
ncbi:MAG: AMP-binding protein, partial [Clostridiales bacterium]|nr:AMP-binding protein [Clostridiales bacterium]